MVITLSSFYYKVARNWYCVSCCCQHDHALRCIHTLVYWHVYVQVALHLYYISLQRLYLLRLVNWSKIWFDMIKLSRCSCRSSVKADASFKINAGWRLSSMFGLSLRYVSVDLADSMLWACADISFPCHVNDLTRGIVGRDRIFDRCCQISNEISLGTWSTENSCSCNEFPVGRSNTALKIPLHDMYTFLIMLCVQARLKPCRLYIDSPNRACMAMTHHGGIQKRNSLLPSSIIQRCAAYGPLLVL